MSEGWTPTSTAAMARGGRARAWLAAAVCALLLVLPATALASGGWTIATLGYSSDEVGGLSAVAVNVHGDVLLSGGCIVVPDAGCVGYAVWSGHRLTAVPIAGFDMNNAGVVVGDYDPAKRWANGRVTALTGLRWATAVNDAGQVAGIAVAGADRHVPAVWRDGRTVPLSMPAGAVSGWTEGINARGDVVGSVSLPDGSSRAALWRADGRRVDLGPGSAVDVADTGAVVVARPDRYVVWQEGRTRALPVVRGSSIARVAAMNARGDMVGTLALRDGGLVAVRWSGGRLVRLDELLPDGRPWQLERAEAISDRGHIVGSGTDVRGEDEPAVFPVYLIAPPGIDITAPVIAAPDYVDLNAQTPAGARLANPVTAVDETDGAVAVRCEPPADRVFPIGFTLLRCLASDRAGNTAEHVVYVTVWGAGKQLRNVRASVRGQPMPPAIRAALLDHVNRALRGVVTQRPGIACRALTRFAADVETHRAALGGAADRLERAARRIQRVVPC